MEVIVVIDGMIEDVNLSSLCSGQAYYHNMQDYINGTIQFAD